MPQDGTPYSTTNITPTGKKGKSTMKMKEKDKPSMEKKYSGSSKHEGGGSEITSPARDQSANPYAAPTPRKR